VPSTKEGLYVRFSATLLAFAITLLAITYVTHTLSVVSFAAAFSVGFVLFFAQSIPQFVEDYATAQGRRRAMEAEVEAAAPFLSRLGVLVRPREFVEAHAGMKVPEPLMLSVPQQILEEWFPHLGEARRRVLLAFLLADRWKAGGLAPGVGVPMHQLILGLFEASVRQEGTRRDFVRAYASVRGSLGLRPKEAPPVDLESLFAGAPGDALDDAALADFIDTYAMEERFQYLRRVLDNAGELRHALKHLIESGALRSYGVTREALASMDEHLQDAPLRPGAFVVLKNKWEELNRYLDRLPSLRGSGGAIARNFEFGAPAARPMVSVSVVKPPGEYASAKEFAELELRPRINSGEGFLAVFGLDTYDSFTISSQRSLSNPLSENYRVVRALQAGYAETDLDVWSEINRATVPVDELLACLPFTVFVDDLGRDERSCLTQAYDRLKEEFLIEGLTDWATIDPASLASSLKALPCTALRGRRARDLAATIVERAASFAESLRGPLPPT
jgi:hypothetical protein